MWPKCELDTTHKEETNSEAKVYLEEKPDGREKERKPKNGTWNNISKIAYLGKKKRKTVTDAMNQSIESRMTIQNGGRRKPNNDYA